MTAGIVMISTAYKQISASEKVDKIEPMLPKSVTIMTAFAVILILSSVVAILLLKKLYEVAFIAEAKRVTGFVDGHAVGKHVLGFL